MIIFKKLRWKNLLSTGNIFTEIDLNTNQTTLIVGDNGSGKSTLLDALSFVLFGKAFRNINKPQLINSITNKNMIVEIEFNSGLNEYKIIRGMKPNVFEVYQNNTLLNQSAEMRDYQEILEKQILKVNHKSFCQVVILGSATFKPFMELPAGQRREIIEDLLDLQIFTTMNLLLKNKITTNNEQLVENQYKKKLVDEKIKLIKEHITELQNNNEQLIIDKKNRIVDTDGVVEKYNDKLKILIANIAKYKDEIADEQSLNKKINKLSQLKHQIEAKLQLLKNEVDFFTKHDTCPTCKQPIEEHFKCETIDTKESEIKKIDDGLIELSNQYNELDAKISEIITINSKITELQLEVHQYRTKINSLLEYKNSLEEEIKNISQKQSDLDMSKLDELESDLNKVKIEYNDLITEKNILSVAGTLLKDGGIKAKIIKQYVPIINKLINKYLSAMDFFVAFELDENFNETIKSRYRDVFSYASFSEGEKMRINLSILFTWRAIAKLRNSINTNILIMDEVFDSSLDANGVEEFLKILNNLTQDTNTFIISHKIDQMYDKFNSVIKFEKKKNFSRIAA